MTAGLQVISDLGLYQIDNSTYCLSVLDYGGLERCGFMWANLVPNYIYSRYHLDVYSEEQPLIALYMPLDSTFPSNYTLLSLVPNPYIANIHSWYLLLAPNLWRIEFNIITNNSLPSLLLKFKWFLIGRPKVTSSSYGLEVYDDAGLLLFSSSWKTIAPTGLLGSSIDTSKRYAYVGGTSYGTVTSSEEMYTDQSIHWITTIDTTGPASIPGGTALLLVQTIYEGGTTDVPTPNLITLQGYVFDVTEYTVP